MLSITVLVLCAGLFLPLAVAPGQNPWEGGGSLSQFRPHLLDGSSNPIIFYVGAFIITVTLAVMLLLGLAGFVGLALWILAIIGSAGLLLISNLFLLGLSVTDEAKVGWGAYALPLGALLTLLCCVIPAVKDAWVRPKAF